MQGHQVSEAEFRSWTMIRPAAYILRMLAGQHMTTYQQAAPPPRACMLRHHHPKRLQMQNYACLLEWTTAAFMHGQALHARQHMCHTLTELWSTSGVHGAGWQAGLISHLFCSHS